MALADSLARVDAFVEKLPPEYQDAFATALDDLKNVIEMEVDAAVKAQAAKVPIVGGIAASIINGAINKALDDGLAELTAAKSAYAGA